MVNRTAADKIRVITTMDRKLLERIEIIRAAQNRSRSKMVEILLKQAVAIYEVKAALAGTMPEIEKMTIDVVEEMLSEMGLTAWRAGRLTGKKREEVIRAFKDRLKEK
jgi:hypothetical protein